MNLSWRHFRNHYLIPMNLDKLEWERLKIEGKIPEKAKWAKSDLSIPKSHSH